MGKEARKPGKHPVKARSRELSANRGKQQLEISKDAAKKKQFASVKKAIPKEKAVVRKDYPDQLGLWVRQHVKTQHDVNLAAFNAVRDDVIAALDAGYAMKTIWKNMSANERISFGYDSFRRYVQQLNREAVPAAPKPVPDPVTPAKPAQPVPGVPASLPAKLPGFVLNPNPTKEELL